MFDRQRFESSGTPEGKIHKAYINQGPQLTSRLEYALRFTGQQGALRFDQWQKLLGRLSTDSDRMKVAGILSEERTRKILRRWSDEEIYMYRVFHVREKGWIWLTRKGLKYVGLNLRYYEPAPSSLPHLYALNEIRLLLGARYHNHVWKSERELRAEQSSQQKEHLPDAEFLDVNGQHITALEVLLNVRSEARLQDMLYDFASDNRYHAIWYFVSKPVFGALTQALDKLSVKQQRRFAIYDLEGKPYE